jgi:hypothetical protein
MRVTDYLAVIGCLLGAGTAFLNAENPGSPDIEQAHAFLVKLKSGKTSRSVVDDDWQMAPLANEAQTRGEAAPSANWWYLSHRSRSGRSGAESASSAEDWDRAYDMYAGNVGSANRGAGGARVVLQHTLGCAPRPGPWAGDSLRRRKTLRFLLRMRR